MKPEKIFINEFGRLRSGTRFTIFILAFILLTVFLSGAIGAVLINLPAEFSENTALGFLAPMIILLTAAIISGWLGGKLLEDLPFRALGAWFTKNWLKDFSFGLVIGAMTIAFAASLLIAFGATHFQFNRDAGQTAIMLTLAGSFSIFAVGAAAEEAFFRGYMFQTFTRAKLILFAVLMTSAMFAVMHVRNPSANYISFVNTFLAGIWFGAAYLKTRTLWLAFGLHLAWNWMQGAVLGISVSGITSIAPAPVLQATNVGSEIITGGDYGIEGGIVCTIALIVSSLVIWFAPIFKPTEEMLRLTSEEKPATKVNS